MSVDSPAIPLRGARRALAHRALRSALAAAFRAQSLPACARLLGPIVPGATMPGGARVPGTSLELDPVEAACSFALLLHWQATDSGLRPATAGFAPAPRNALAALLGVADWLARRALMEGRRPLTVHELLSQVMATHDLELELEGALGTGLAPLIRVEVALTSGVARLLGRPGADLPAALDIARTAWQRPSAGPGALELAEASGRAVRRALLEWKTSGAVATAAIDAGTAASAAGSAMDRATDYACGEAAEFAAAVTLRFPAKQARSILAACADPERLEACPVNGFVALLVTN